MCVYCIYYDMLLLTDTQGLTDAINNTGRVYEEIGNMHGQEVSSVRTSVYSLSHITMCDLLLTCSDPIM